MQHLKLLNRQLIAALAVACGVLASANALAASGDVDMWDGQSHVELTPYLWVPWLISDLQLPAVAGGGDPSINTQPSQYLKHLDGAVMLDGSFRKGDASLWMDYLYLNLSANPTVWHQIGLPNVDPTLPVSLSMDLGIRASILTLAPSFTVMNNNIGTLDILAGLRYTSVKASFSYVLSGPRDEISYGGGFWPSFNSTDIIAGIRGSLKLSPDGKWFLPYEMDVGDGTGNWEWNAMLGAGYHFHWGDVELGVRNLNYHRSKDGSPLIQTVRFTGPVLGASFRW
jgi:hypothetical protein